MNRVPSLGLMRPTQGWSWALASLIASTATAQTLPPPPASPAPVVNLEYDAQGNATRTIQAPGINNLSTSNTYDRLQRRTQSVDARGKTTQFLYNGRDDLVHVTDPRSLVTQYPRNGLGDATSLLSPDTGTATHTYDAAGNLKTRTDSRGVAATYSYDALNRLNGISYGYVGGGTPQVFGWTYDQTGPGFSNGIGRLTSTSFPAGSSRYTYDAQGRVLTAIQTVTTTSPVSLGTGYGYDASGHLTRISYPSGRVLSLSYSGGLPIALSLAPNASQAAMPLVSGLQFNVVPGADATPRSWSWQLNAGTLAQERAFDVYGRMVRYPLGGAVRDINYDSADRIVAYTHWNAVTGAAVPMLDQRFGYDELARLTTVATSQGAWSYTYDDNGNRLTQTLSTAGTSITRLSSIDATSNRLTGLTSPAQSFYFDSAGNANFESISTGASSTFRSGWTDNAGRLAGLKSSVDGQTFYATLYNYDAAGMRVVKQYVAAQRCTTTCVNLPVSPFTVYMYDLQGHLLGEYDQVGAVLREYVWLGDLPVAVIDGPASNPQVYFIQIDHLGTPRVLIDRAGQQRWSWLAEPFGNSAPVENPIGAGPVKLNLRMPGQYFDEESGWVYNWMRSYDPAIGRFTQSDPIGLAGGINTYAYVENQPTSLTDPLGLEPRNTGRPAVLVCVYRQGGQDFTCIDESSGVTVVAGSCYSGTGAGRNNPDMNGVPSVGPTPRGWWGIGAPQDIRLGRPSYRLTPDPDNSVFQTRRQPQSFLIHADNAANDASEGCTICEKRIRDIIARYPGSRMVVQ